MVGNRERLYRIDAVILKRTDMGEADRLLTIHSREHGKIRAVAKGVRKISSRKSGHVELFMRSRLLLARGRELDIITQAEVMDPFLPLRDDLWRVTHACYAAELLDSFTPEGEENEPLYNLLVSVMGWICQDDDMDRLMRFYELRLLDYSGLRPELFNCVRCRIDLEPERNYFSVVDGGVICPRCAQGRSGLQRLELGPFKVLRFFQTRDYETCRGIRIHPRTNRELERIMHRYITYHLERQIKSTEFLQLLRADGAAQKPSRARIA